MNVPHLQTYLQPGAHIGEFIVDKPLPAGKGEGGMAIVFIGHPRYRRQGIPNRVAVKVNLPGEQKFLSHEAWFLKRFDHPHVVKMYPLPKSGKYDMAIADLPNLGRIYYYAMEYLPGGTLRERLKKEEPLQLLEILTIGRQIAAALEHIHSHNIINLDVKPENILFRTPRRRWLRYALPEAVLCDFGAARQVGEPGLGERVGSENYASPEQWLEGKKHSDVGYRSDLFMLGVLLYEMLTGELPFKNRQQIIDPHYVPDSPGQLAFVPQSLDGLVMRALAKNPADRFQSVRQMREALEAVPHGIHWPGLPRIVAPVLVTAFLATAVYTAAPPVISSVEDMLATATPTVTVTSTATSAPPTGTVTLSPTPTTPTVTAPPTVTRAPTRTPTFTPRPTAVPTATPDTPPAPEP